MAAYHPIDCGMHSRYELAIMREQELSLRWQTVGGDERAERVRPVDIFTKNHEEFLAVVFHGRREEIRLDRILEVLFTA